MKHQYAPSYDVICYSSVGVAQQHPAGVYPDSERVIRGRGGLCTNVQFQTPNRVDIYQNRKYDA